MRRLERFSADELAAAILLVVVIGLALVRADVITEIFEPPYATPAPGGGPARQIVPSSSP